MRPDQAISKVAYEAVDLLEAYQARGGDGDPQQLANCLYASVQAIMLTAGMFEKETAEPGHIAALKPEFIAHILGEAHAAAAGVLLVCSLLPGVDSLVPPEVQ
jgi:hypothetical protein